MDELIKSLKEYKKEYDELPSEFILRTIKELKQKQHIARNVCDRHQLKEPCVMCENET